MSKHSNLQLVNEYQKLSGEFKKRIMKKTFTRDDMLYILARRKSIKYKKNMRIIVYNRMERDAYEYILTNSMGRGMRDDFTPDLTPPQMLKLGVFEGKYCNDCILEYPKEWFINKSNTLIKALSPERPDIDVNYFKIKSRLALSEWVQRQWIPCTMTRIGRAICKRSGVNPNDIHDYDNRGWFQWYCRYYMGRRLLIIDDIQIQRWKNFKRHYYQLVKHCAKGDMSCRRRQRQALLQWGYDTISK